MANDFNASLVISTSEAVTNVRNVDAAAKDLDKTLAHLHTTMAAGQNDLTALAGSLKVFKDTQRQANRDQKDRTDLLIKEAKLEREGIVNKGKLSEATGKQAQNEAKLAGIRARNSRNSASGLGNEMRRNAESDARIANAAILTNNRAATELERKAAAEQRTALVTAQRAAADDRAAISALRLANAQEKSHNASLALNDSLSNSRYLLYDVGATYATLSAILLAVPAATTAVAASYEKDFTNVIRTTGLAKEEASGLYQELKSLGREIPLSFGQFSEIASIAGQLGIAQSQVGAFTETVAKFGAASNVATSEAATAFGRLENSFNQDGQIPDFFNRIGSAIAKVGVESAASETEIIAVTNQISAAGAQFGFTADQIVGLSGALASVRIRPELARGAFQRILLGLSRAADEGSESFDKFAKYTSQTGQAAIDLFKNNPSKFFQEYIAGIKGTIDAGNSVSSVLDDIGAKNVFDKQFILGLANGLNVYNKSMSDSATAFEEGTFLSESTQATFETFVATLTKLGTALSNLGATLGGGSLGPLTDMAETVLNVVNGMDRLISQQPAIGAVINTLLAVGGVTGVFLAFKSAQAFVLAGLVGLQQVMGKTAIAGALSLRGNVSELAKTMLMSKGATAEAAQAYIAATTPMRALGAAATATRTQVAGLNTTLATNGTAVMAVDGQTRTAGGALKGFGNTAMGLVGGPIGALVIGLGALITSFISTQEEAAQAGDAIARSMQNGTDAVVRTSAQALSKIKVQWTDSIAFGNLNKTLVEVAQNAGVSFDKIAAAASKGKDAGKEILAVMNEVAQNKGFKDFADLQANSFGSENHRGELQFLVDKITDIGNESGKSAEGLKAVDKAAAAAGESANQAAPSAEGLAEGLGGVTESADDAAKAITDAVNAIFGLVDAEAATQESLGRLGAGLQGSTSLSTGDEGGRENLSNLRDAMRNAALEQQQLIDSGVQTAEQAAANYTAFIDGLMRELAAKGVDVGQIQGLAEQAKGVFGTTFASGVQPTITPRVDASQVAAEAQTATTQLQAYISSNNPKFAIGADTSEAYNRMFVLANSLAEITGYDYKVILDALTDPAHEKSKEIYELIKSITDQTYTAPINADTSAAVANVKNFADYASQQLNAVQSAYNEVAASAPTLAKYTQSLFPGAKSAGTAPAGIAAPTQSSVAQVAAPTQVKSAAPSIATPDFAGLSNGYNDAAKAAEKAGDAGKKAGDDMADGIDDATRAADDYASRLRAGLQSAFDKQYAMATAADAYHTALNSINKKRDDELNQIQELIAKQKELNNSRKEDLITARKAGIEKAISQKYGETDRAADYGQQEQTALDSAAAKQKDIDATKLQASEIQAGIGKLTGYSQAAIDNRAALRDLESKMLDMVSAYASTGKSAEQVRVYTQRLTGQFRNDVAQLGYNRTAVANLQGNLSRYIGVVNAVPRTKATKVTADTGQATSAIGGVNRALGGLRNKEVSVRVNYRGTVFPIEGKRTKAGDQVYGVTNPDTGRYNGTMLFNKGGQVPGFAGGGQVPGRSPSDPSVDNMFARVDGKGIVGIRSGEFIIQQPAVDYWGLDMFKQLNNMKMPAFNAGGSVGGGRAGAASGGPMLVELTAENIAAIQRMPNIILTTENRVIAQSANDGNAILATQGAS